LSPKSRWQRPASNGCHPASAPRQWATKNANGRLIESGRRWTDEPGERGMPANRPLIASQHNKAVKPSRRLDFSCLLMEDNWTPRVGCVGVTRFRRVQTTGRLEWANANSTRTCADAFRTSGSSDASLRHVRRNCQVTQAQAEDRTREAWVYLTCKWSIDHAGNVPLPTTRQVAGQAQRFDFRERDTVILPSLAYRPWWIDDANPDPPTPVPSATPMSPQGDGRMPSPSAIPAPHEAMSTPMPSGVPDDDWDPTFPEEER